MYKQAWRIVRNTLLLAGVLLGFVVAVELLRIFAFFHRIHPGLAWAYAAVLGFGVLAAVIYWIVQWASYPRVLAPPPRLDLARAGFNDLRAYCRYLLKYLDRLSRNSRLSDDERAAASNAIAELRDILHAHPLIDDLARGIEDIESKCVAPLLARLEEVAAAEVRHSVRDVMLGVSLSPFHSVDLLVVLYRNSAMILRIVRVYASRPAPREQLLILRDTLRVVAAVNLLNLGRTLFESLFANLPLIGRAIDDIAQGLGAGLLTSAAGHAAIARCAAFRGWDAEEATSSLADHAVHFFGDVKDIFAKDILPALKSRIRATTPAEAAEQPGFWDSLVRGVAKAVDATATAIGSYVIEPAMAGTAGVVKTGYRVTRRVVRAGSSMTRHTARTGASAFRGVSRFFRSIGQRIRYSRRPPPGR
ncbi:MAG: DUF697 domain-containing protein [Kiritimatiellae bacterium]|nr:DUF697 domain-containing protein [Kiritimatiellia bacterium]